MEAEFVALATSGATTLMISDAWAQAKERLQACLAGQEMRTTCWGNWKPPVQTWWLLLRKATA